MEAQTPLLSCLIFLKVEDNFTATITIETPYHLVLQAFGSNTFVDGSTRLDMLGQNLQSVTIMKQKISSDNWKIINQVPLCVVGKSCWSSNHLYIGNMNGYQIFTTPRGCDDSREPRCEGRDDSVLKSWANNSPEVDNQLTDLNNDGPKNSEILNSYESTDAAHYCENLVYAEHDDWYLPRPDELRLLFDAAKTDIYFISDVDYWSSQDFRGTEAYALNPYQRIAYSKSEKKYVRCVRRQ